MVEDTLSNFLKGTLDKYWENPPSLSLYKELYAYDLHKGWSKADEKVRVHWGIFIDAANYAMNYFGEPLNLEPILKYPLTPIIIDDVNALFGGFDFITDPSKVLMTDFPYILVKEEDILSTYNKKKRWKFRKSLEVEGDIMVRQVSDFQPTAMRIMRSRLHQLDGVNNSVIIPQALKESGWNFRLFQMYKGRKIVGLACAINTAPDTVYVGIFHSIEPCIYNLAQSLYSQYTVGTKIHFGAAHTFVPECNAKYVYKHNIANAYLQSPYLYVSATKDGFPPYYSIVDEKWCLQ